MSQESRQHAVDSKKESIQQTVGSRQGKTKGFLSTVYSLLSTKKGLLSTKAGFSLVELMITMVIFLIVIAAASGILTAMITQFKQQSKIAETNIEGIVGLDIMRRDIEHAGYGLPWNVTGVIDADDPPDGNLWEHLPNYNEAAAAEPAVFNDATRNLDGDGYDGEEPRAIVSGNNMNFSSPNNIFDGSDYLVIKALNVAGSEASEKWTHLYANFTLKEWLPAGERLTTSDRLIVLRTDTRALIVSGTRFTTRYRSSDGTLVDPDGSRDDAFYPPDNVQRMIAYGVTPKADPVAEPLRMPFNRADYFIRKFDSNGNDIVPNRCATNTGVLEKGTVNQGNGALNFTPLLDCVADMQVTFWLDTDADGDIDWPPSPSDNIGPGGLNLTAQQIRDQVREVRVYIVAHEGQKDMNFDFSMNNTRESLTVTEINPSNPSESRAVPLVNLKTRIGNPEYKYYRWKVYTMVVKPNNLR